MKSFVSDEKRPTDRPFPKLMLSKKDHLIVLFCEPRIGTVLSTNDATFWSGRHESIWDMGWFVDFEGEITLSND